MYEFPPGSTSVTIYVFLRDAQTNQGKTGLTPATPGAKASYTRNRSASTPFTLVALATPQDAWVSGGFIECDDDANRGLYRVDVPNNACASGVPHSVVNLSFDNTFDEGALIKLRSTDGNVGAGGTSFPITVTKADTTPIAGAQVWVTTDEDGDNVYAGALTTNAFGIATFMLDDGTYYAWFKAAEYTGPNPTTLTVP